MPTPDLTNIGPIGPTGPSAEFGPPVPPEMEGPTGPTFEGAPTVKPGVINVISPEGEPMELDIDWLIKPDNMRTFQSEGWSLPSKPKAQQDLVREGISPGSVLVISPKGEEQELDAEWLKDPANAATFQQEGWKLGEAPTVSHNKRVNQDFKDLTTAGWSRIDERHAMDAVTDDDGNYKLLDLNGDPVLATRKQLIPLLSSGFSFQDPNFQALYDANRRLAEDAETAADVGMTSVADSVPGLKWLTDKITDNFGTAAGKASNIALDVARVNEQKTAATAGTVAGIGMQLGIPTGVFGEVKLAQAAKAGILGKLAPEGASFGKQLLAKGLGTAAEGAIITAPQAIAQLALEENPKAAAESIGLGIGIGLILGVGGPILSKTGELGLSGLKKGVEKIEPYFQKKAVDLASGGVSAETKVAEKIASAKSPSAIVEAMAERPAAQRSDNLLAENLLDINKTARGSDEKVLNGLRKISEGDRLPSLLKEADRIDAKINGAASTAIDDIFTRMDEYVNKMLEKHPELTFANESIKQKLRSFASASGDRIKLSDLQKFIGQMGDEINWNQFAKGEGKYADILKSKFWGVAVEKLQQQTDNIINQSKEVALIDKWQIEKTLISDTLQGWRNGINNPKELKSWVKSILDAASNKTTGLLAGSVGGPLGMVAGTMAADAVQPITTAVENMAASSGNKFLTKNKLSNAIGSYGLIDSIKHMEFNINQIPAYLKDMGTVLKIGAIKVPAAFIPEKDPIKSILGQEANGLTKNQQFNRLSDRLAALSSSPEMMQKNFELYIAPIFKDHPQLAGQLFTDYQQKIQTLNQIVNMYNNKQPEAFTGKEKKFEPTPSQMAEIDGLLKVAMNPYALMDGLKNGRVTSKQVALVAELNPAILQKIREELVKTAYSGKVNLPYQQRLTASIIMGAPMDPGLRNGAALQATYGKAQATNQPPPKSQGNSKPLKADKISPYTATQRITKL